MTCGCHISLQSAWPAGCCMLPVYQSAACKVSCSSAPGIGAWLAVCQLFGVLVVLAGVVVFVIRYTATYFPVSKR